MVRLGEMQQLCASRSADVGVYLSLQASDEEVLLPKSQVPPGIKDGDELEVFVYRDSEDRLIATTTRPILTVGEVGALRVKEVTKIGAFLDWGLPKDLLLPYREQRGRVKVGREYPVGVYIDNSDRLCATMQVYDFLEADSPYKFGDRIEGIVYDISEDLGALVAVERRFHGLIPKTELIDRLKAGDPVVARVARVRQDGKLILSLRKSPDVQIEQDAQLILRQLKSAGGALPFNDKSSPDQIKARFGMSKGAFKKATGRLLKEKKIEFTNTGIKDKGTGPSSGN
ncbi:MAG: S1 RNA-binding domain-containing protein [Firmicutes bacterium]|nr:S1 RNA-binding domain-containing protein [Bacillota bacterium]